MKNFFLLAFSLFVMTLNAQVMVVDFEDNGLVPPKPDCNPTAEWVTDPNVPIVTTVANPDTTGNNTPNCVKFVETAGSAVGNSLQLAFNGATATTGHNLVTNKYVRFMIYSENQTNFDVLLELGTGGTPHYAMSKSITTTLNTWTVVEFDFTGNDPTAVINNAGGWSSNIRIHFNNGTNGSGDVYYVDEYFISPTSTVAPPVVPPSTIVDFEENAPGLLDCNPTPEWPGDPNAPLVTVEPNPNTVSINPTPNCVKFVETTGSAPGNSLQLAFNGTTATTGHNLVSHDFVKFMVYSENQTNFDILLELGTGGTPHFAMTKNVTVPLNTWTEVEFDFSGNDASAIINNAGGWISNIRIHFNNGTNGQGDVYYVDEYSIAQNSTIGNIFTNQTTVFQTIPVLQNYDVTNTVWKKVNMQLSTAGDYANFSLYANNELVLDNVDLANAGVHDFNAVVEFPQTGNVVLKLVATSSDVDVLSFDLVDYTGVTYPTFSDITNNAGIVDETSLKYGGPTIADLDNDGDYDLVLNNHNDSPSKLYWNNGNNTFTKNSSDLSLWNMMDLHGSAAGDYDNDGDLDIIISLGGGNGTNPAPPVFYRNDNGVMNRVDAQIGITSGARGRSPRWSDMDMDGDLDLMLINAAGINGGGGVQHIFYENKGDGTFQTKNVAGLENAGGEKLLVTDFDGDQIDDVLMFQPMTAWKGNGDFTFTQVSLQWFSSVINTYGTMAATDIDFDNDGDLDIYLARGTYYFGIAQNNSVDFNASNQRIDARTSGSQGTLPFEVTSTGDIMISGFDYVTRNGYNGGFPLFLGDSMVSHTLGQLDDTLVITQAMANGWSQTRTANGFYIGHVGNGVWKLETVRDQDIYWSIHFTLDNVNSFTPDGWSPFNRNQYDDILLENTGTSFVKVEANWNVPKGGNHWGVTRGDFNNDGWQDLYVYRMGFLKNRVADYILMNDGQGSFEVSTSHAASNQGARNHGDMGQAFDYDLDGDVDILNGDDEYGLWHLYENAGTSNNHVLVKVNYSPGARIDQYGATVTVHTGGQSYFQRVGSAGEAHSQSLLNIVHFGLGQATQIDSIIVVWRNGERLKIENPSVNQMAEASWPLSTNPLANNAFGMGQFYPNPTNTGQVNIDYKATKSEKMPITIFDISGKLVFQEVQQIVEGENTLQLDLSTLQQGFYFVRLGEHNSIFRKLIIE